MFCLSICLVHHVCAWPCGSEEGVGSPGSGITDGWKHPHGCWDSNPCVLNCWAISPVPAVLPFPEQTAAPSWDCLVPWTWLCQSSNSLKIQFLSRGPPMSHIPQNIQGFKELGKRSFAEVSVWHYREDGGAVTGSGSHHSGSVFT